MVSIDWCKKTKNGLQLILPNDNMSRSYINMAEESIKSLSKEESNIWIATMSYYVFYYSLYALMLKIGIRCEIHSCSLEFMRVFLREYLTQKDNQAIQTAFKARINLQYYADRPVDQKDITQSKAYCKIFFLKIKDILSKVSESEIALLREGFRSS